jgi:hypothetical protein
MLRYVAVRYARVRYGQYGTVRSVRYGRLEISVNNGLPTVFKIYFWKKCRRKRNIAHVHIILTLSIITWTMSMEYGQSREKNLSVDNRRNVQDPKF